KGSGIEEDYEADSSKKVKNIQQNAAYPQTVIQATENSSSLENTEEDDEWKELQKVEQQLQPDKGVIKTYPEKPAAYPMTSHTFKALAASWSTVRNSLTTPQESIYNVLLRTPIDA
ncbi:hypothetical protein HAX54_040490, partial [Datura stramonium]|nr:hypothetical protein [Datura stramonium]